MACTGGRTITRATLRAANMRKVANIDRGRLYSIEDFNKTLGVSPLGLVSIKLHSEDVAERINFEVCVSMILVTRWWCH